MAVMAVLYTCAVFLFFLTVSFLVINCSSQRFSYPDIAQSRNDGASGSDPCIRITRSVEDTPPSKHWWQEDFRSSYCTPSVTGSSTENDANVWVQVTPDSDPAVNFTVVTALFDIGRGQWQNYVRAYSQYLLYMEQLMRLHVNIIAFVDSEAATAVRRVRRDQLRHMTKVVEMRVQDLPYFRHRERIQEIMNSEEYRRDNGLATHRHPEATVPEYDIVTLSKFYFLDNATRMDPFNSSYFMWLDAGYGHGEDIYPKDGVWTPKHLFEHSDKVTVIELGLGYVQAVKNDLHHLHKLRVALINGGFIAGGKRALQRLHVLEREVVADWLTRGIIDDDQSCLVMVYYKEPNLFRVVTGDWYDVFKLFGDYRE